MDGFQTQRAFHTVQEHLKITSNKEVMVVRSWRTQPENPVHQTSRGLLFSVISGHNLSSSCINLYMGALIKRFQEFPLRNPNEGVMEVTSHEKNQQLAALAAAEAVATALSHFIN